MVFSSQGRNLFLSPFLHNKKGRGDMANTAEKGIEQLCKTNILRIGVLVTAIVTNLFSKAIEEMFLMVILYWGIGTIVAVVKQMLKEKIYGHTAIISSILLGVAIVVGGVYYSQQNILCQYLYDFVVALMLALSEVLAPSIFNKTK